MTDPEMDAYVWAVCHACYLARQGCAMEGYEHLLAGLREMEARDPAARGAEHDAFVAYWRHTLDAYAERYGIGRS